MLRTIRRRTARLSTVSATAVLIGLAAAAPAHAAGVDLGFTPITTNAVACSSPIGLPAFASPLVPTQLMQAYDPATPVNAPATSNFVGTENDMNALSPNSKYLFAVSELGGTAPVGSNGVTRLPLTGPGAGTKELLALFTAGPIWQRLDGTQWYPFGGPGTNGAGVLLVSEENGTAGRMFQVNPDTGAIVEITAMGKMSLEGVAIDPVTGTLYYGDENRTGAIFKFVPNDKTNLTLGGALSYMVGTGIDASRAFSTWKGDVCGLVTRGSLAGFAWIDVE